MLLAVKERRGWTYRQLAAHLHVSERTVKRWIAGATDPHPAWMTLVQRLFDETFHDQAAA